MQNRTLSGTSILSSILNQFEANNELVRQYKI